MPEPVAASTVATYEPVDLDELGVTRRQFLNRSIVGLMGLSIAIFAAAAFPAFLWPTGSGGFGGIIHIGKLSDIVADIVKPISLGGG